LCAMGVMEVTREMLAAKFESIFPHLDERQRRLLMGAEARVLGPGGPAGAASGRPTWIPGCARRCWRWSSLMSGAIRCPRCGGRRSRPVTWRRS